MTPRGTKLFIIITSLLIISSCLITGAVIIFPRQNYTEFYLVQNSSLGSISNYQFSPGSCYLPLAITNHENGVMNYSILVNVNSTLSTMKVENIIILPGNTEFRNIQKRTVNIA